MAFVNVTIDGRRAIDCMTCEKNGDCLLQEYCYEYRVTSTPARSRPWPRRSVASAAMYGNEWEIRRRTG